MDTYIDVVLPTYRLEPDEKDRFYPSMAKEIADNILKEELNGVVYEEEDAKNLSLNISDRVREAVYEILSKSRYKVVVQTTVGQQRDQSIRVASRCLWDPTTDNYASTSYSNETIFCSVLVFALYTE